MLREIDKRHRLTQQLADVLTDQRDPAKVQHHSKTRVAQPVYGIAADYEDLTNHDSLRFDQALQTATCEDQPLAGKSTLSCLERRADRQAIVQAYEVL